MTDPFDTVREAISVYHVASGKKEEAHAALASIEERLRETEQERGTILAYLRELIYAEWGQNGPYTGSFDQVNEFISTKNQAAS